MDVIDNTPVPALVYGRRLHIISLSAIPDEGRGPAARRSSNGYNVVSWRENGVSYWAVSDLGVGELETFAQLFRKAPTGWVERVKRRSAKRLGQAAVPGVMPAPFA